MICTSKTKSLTPFYTSLLVRPLQLYDLFDWMILHNNQYIKPRGILKKKYTRPHIWSRFFENQVQYLTKISVVWVKRRQKACFLSPRSSKIIVTKRKERRKRKSEEKERRRWKKSNGCTLSFYNSYFGDSFWLEKNCSMQKVSWR